MLNKIATIKSLLGVVVLFFHSLACFPQQISLQVLDSTSKKPIAFCTIVNKTKNNGGYSDSTGNLNLFGLLGDTLIVASLGYETKKIVIQTLDPQSVLLNPTIHVLRPVTVSNFFWLKNKRVELREFPRKVEHFNPVVKGVTLLKYLRSPDTTKSWIIGFLHVPVNVKDDYVPRLARVYFYESTNTGDIGKILPNSTDEIFTLDKIVEKTLIIDVNKLELVMPKNGCYVALEFVGYANNFTSSKGIFAIQSSFGDENSKCFMRYFTDEFLPYNSYRGSVSRPLNLHIGCVLYQYER